MDVRSELKPPVEVRYREELEALRALDTDRKPLNWKMSPKAVRTFILGSREPLSWNGKEISIRKKYLGNDALVERCITVDGSAVKEPKNLLVPIGTRISCLIDNVGGFSCEPGKVLFGGPMMGHAAYSLDQPVAKATKAMWWSFVMG